MKPPDRIENVKGTWVFFLDGGQVTEEVYRERHPLPKGEGVFMTATARAYPYYADSLGCHPEQVNERMADAAARGVPTNFDPKTGMIEWKSRQHQKEYCQEYGFFNRDENWSSKGPKEPPPPPKKRPKMDGAYQVRSDEPPKMRTKLTRGRRRKS